MKVKNKNYKVLMIITTQNYYHEIHGGFFYFILILTATHFNLFFFQNDHIIHLNINLNAF